MDEENFDKLQAAYDSCLNEDNLKKIGIAPLVHALNQTAQVFAQHDGHDGALSSTLLHLAHLSVSAFFDVDTTADDKDPDTLVVAVSAPYSIGLPAKEFYQDEKVLKSYEEMLSQVIPAFTSGVGCESNHYHEVVELERRLAAASPDAEDRDDVEVSLLLTARAIRY